jgi:DNA-binding transcriptional regulator YiaG
MTPLRNCRLAVGLSQSEFAARLGASVETYRSWDSGRRPTPALMLEKALQWSQSAAGNQLLSLPRLAALLGVHVRTLRLAARDGRLDVFYGNRTLFGHPIPLATLGAGSAFMRSYYKQTTRWSLRPPAPVRLPDAPSNYDAHLKHLRRRLGLTQTELADITVEDRDHGLSQPVIGHRCSSRNAGTGLPGADATGLRAAYDPAEGTGLPTRVSPVTSRLKSAGAVTLRYVRH